MIAELKLKKQINQVTGGFFADGFDWKSNLITIAISAIENADADTDKAYRLYSFTPGRDNSGVFIGLGATVVWQSDNSYKEQTIDFLIHQPLILAVGAIGVIGISYAAWQLTHQNKLTKPTRI